MRTKRTLITGIAGLVLTACAAVAWAQMVLEVIPLKYRTAEEIVPILEPMLAREGSVSELR